MTLPETELSTPIETEDDLLAGLTLKPAPAMVDIDDPAARHGVVIRESAKWDAGLLQGMASQVLRRCAAGGVPGAEDVLVAVDDGFLPWARTPEGEKWRRDRRAVSLSEPGGRVYGYRFVVSGTSFTIAATSATQLEADEDLSNPFTDDLISWLRSTSIDHLWTGPSSRLIRRKALAEKLRRAFGNRTVVHTKEGRYDFVRDRSAADQMWSLAGMFADQEVKGILLRTVLGRIHAARMNRWPESAVGLPPTAALDEQRRIVPITGATELAVLRCLVEVAAELEQEARSGSAMTPATARAVLERLSQAGATSGASPVTELRAPVKAVAARSRSLLPAITGEYRRLQYLPDQDFTVDDLHVPVLHDEERGRDAVVMRWRIPTVVDVLSDVDPKTIDLALEWARRVAADEVDSDGRRDSRLPLGGKPVVVQGAPEGCSWSLVRQQERYVVVEHPEGTAPTAVETPTTVIATMHWRDLHSALVDAIAQAAANDDTLPLDAPLPRASVVPPSSGTSAGERKANLALRTAREHLAALETQLDGLAVFSGELQRSAKAELEPKIAAATSQVEALEDQAIREAAEAERDAVAADTGVNRLVDLLAVLEAQGPAVPAVRAHVRRTVARLEIAPTFYGAVNAAVQLRVRDTNGVDRLTEPIPFRVNETSKGYLKGDDEKVRRDRRARLVVPGQLHRRFTEDMAIAELSLTGNDHKTRQNMLRALTGHPMGAYSDQALPAHLASAAIDAGPVSTRTIIYALLARDGLLGWQQVSWPDGAVPAAPPIPRTVEDLSEVETGQLVQHLELTYLASTEEQRPSGWSRGGERTHRSILLAVAAAPNQTMPADTLRQLLNNKRPIRTLADARVAYRRYNGLEVVGDTHAPMVTLRRCKYCPCKEPMHVLNVPELPDGLLCRGCRRAPTLPDVKFTASYLREWEGPARTSRDRTARARDTVGTAIAKTPAVAVAPSRRQPEPARKPTTCRFRAHRGSAVCGAAVPDIRRAYCDAHSDRVDRQRLKTAADVATRVCRSEGCNEAVTWSGRGRVPVTCLQHRTGRQHERLEARSTDHAPRRPDLRLTQQGRAPKP